MAERLLLEGADLPALMEYVRSEFGPTAKIVHAERVRQGGFAGFFTKEKYELTVEVPAPAPPTPSLRSRWPAPARARASSMDDLLAAADASDSAPGAQVPTPRVPVPSPDKAKAEIVAQPRAAARAATPRAATGGAQFSTVLDQVRALAAQGLPPEALTAPSPSAADLAATSQTVDAAAVAGTTAASGTAPGSGTPAPAAAEAGGLAGLAGPAAVAATARGTGAAGAGLAGSDAVPGRPGSAAEAGLAGSAAAPGPAVGPTGAADRRDLPVVPTPPASPAAEAAPDGVRLRSALTRLGVPDDLLDVWPLTLSAVLDQIPAAGPMPRRPGEILALVGSSGDLAGLEPLLVERMRLTPPDVVHAGTVLRFDPTPSGPDRPTRVSSTHSLSVWRSRAPMARHPWLVMIPVDGASDARAEAAEMAFAARPTQLWAVVDARTKPGDASRWLEQVGAAHPIDALAVRALSDTCAPGTVLGLGHPVAWLDGLPTSRVVWAAALGQPLDAALGQ